MRNVLSSLVVALALAACSSGHLGDQTSDDPGTSPGTVTFHLSLSSTQSFCDQLPGCGVHPLHVSFRTQSGQTINTSGSYCGLRCSTCVAVPCPAIPCVDGQAGGVVLTKVDASWDGSYIESSTCATSAGTTSACSEPRFVRPGRYVAHMCATPGTVTMDGPAPSCTSTGPEECLDVAFDLPGPSPVEATLPVATL